MENIVLIVDDVDINRAMLSEIFKDNYEIREAANGAEALEIINSTDGIAALLLDLLMPGMNGLEVLKSMNESGAIKRIPVFLITAADSTEMLLEGYNLGAIDVISKPFMTHFLKRRVNNVVELYRHKNHLEVIVEEQVSRFKKFNQSMVEALATIIEFRDCESGEHVKRICGLTQTLMTELSNMYEEYRMPKEEIDKIVMASILHDVGKISIPDSILNKPGRLTNEEFAVMKEHTTRGCAILESITDIIIDKDLYNYSYDICRHHHERYDGRGYPDGLKGDEISIWSQIVSVADVFDALTSDRVYKKAFSREKAVEMIFNGECGVFNSKVLEAFKRTLA